MKERYVDLISDLALEKFLEMVAVQKEHYELEDDYDMSNTSNNK